MTLATRNAILDKLDWDYSEFDVPDWGRVRIRALSAVERLSLAKDYGGDLDAGAALTLFCKLIEWSVVDENGKQLFTPADHEALSRRNWNRLQFLSEQIFAFNGLGKDHEQELEKN